MNCPKERCPKCGRFLKCQIHNYSLGVFFTREYFCSHCHLVIPILAEIQARSKI